MFERRHSIPNCVAVTGVVSENKPAKGLRNMLILYASNKENISLSVMVACEKLWQLLGYLTVDGCNVHNWTWNKWEDQLDATTTIYWSPRSAQRVSGNLLPIFRSARLRFLQHMVSCCCAALRTPAYHNNRIPYAVKMSVLRSWRRAKDCPKHVTLILEISKLLLLHLVGSSTLLYLHWWCTVQHKSNEKTSVLR